MAAGMLGFAASDTSMKLVLAHLPLGETMTLRGLIAIALGLLYLAASGGLGGLSHALARPVLLRSAFDALTAVLFLSALAAISLATLTSTLQATPLFATALAAVLLGERVGWRRWSATLVGCVGVLVVIGPRALGEALSGVAGPAAVLGLGAAAAAAARDIVTRFAPRAAPTFVIALAGVAAIALVGIGIGLGERWLWPTPLETALLAVAAAGLLAGNVGVSAAMRVGDVSFVAPFRYVIVIWATLSSWLLFADPPAGHTLAGVAILIAAGLYTARRERIRRAGSATE